MTFQEAKEYLDSFINFELRSGQEFIPFRLERVRRLLSLIGDPQEGTRFIHVAGTKGKGSTCAFMAYILWQAGYKTGLYTSPHLHDFRERIRLFDPAWKDDPRTLSDPFAGQISPSELCATLEAIRPRIEEARRNQDLGRLTYFEVYTALALYYFSKSHAEVVVLETGLGGRLDATNTVRSMACALTSISIEHTRQLGTTLKAISTEKSAIIKEEGQAVVVAPQDKEAMDVIRERCAAFRADAFFIDERRHVLLKKEDGGHQTVVLRDIFPEPLEVRTRLAGRPQRINLAVAAGLCRALRRQGLDIPDGAFVRGAALTQWPGRFEVLDGSPPVVLDGAHNAASVESLVDAVRRLFPGKDVVVIVGISADKNVAAICRSLAALASKVVLTRTRHPRSWDYRRERAASFFSGKEIVCAAESEEALERALDLAGRDDLILVCGSLFVVAEIREVLCRKNPSMTR